MLNKLLSCFKQKQTKVDPAPAIIIEEEPKNETREQKVQEVKREYPRASLIARCYGVRDEDLLSDEEIEIKR